MNPKFPRFIINMTIEIEDTTFNTTEYRLSLQQYLTDAILNPIGNIVVRTIGTPNITEVGL